MALRKLVAGNWKMHGLSSDLAEVQAIAAASLDYPAVDVALCVPAILIERAARAVPGFAIGGQDVHHADKGAHTGCTSALMLLDERSLMAFGDKYDFPLSRRMIDAEIAQLPGTKGLNGQFSEQAYQAFLGQQRLADAEVRQVLAGGLLQRMLLTPVVTNVRVPVGMATPYASMLLEARQGEAVNVPLDVFKAGLQPSDAQLQQFYAANRARYMIPEQRVLRIARIGPEQVASVTASDQEVTAYYNANKTTYAPSDTRSLSQVVVPDQATANAIAQRAKSGQTLSAAAAPARPEPPLPARPRHSPRRPSARRFRADR